MCVDVRGDACRVRCRFVRACDVDLEYPGKAYLELDGAVLVKKVIPDVFCDTKCLSEAIGPEAISVP